MAQAQRRENHLAVVFLDLEGLKAINDQHGHDAGDQPMERSHSLRSAARRGPEIDGGWTWDA
jgi:diguanylate cyclase (GGDEF)-like protein